MLRIQHFLWCNIWEHFLFSYQVTQLVTGVIYLRYSNKQYFMFLSVRCDGPCIYLSLCFCRVWMTMTPLLLQR
jgi:hypothetical protein